MADTVTESLAFLVDALQSRLLDLRRQMHDGTLSAHEALNLLTMEQLLELCRRQGITCRSASKLEVIHLFQRGPDESDLVWDAIDIVLSEAQVQPLGGTWLGSASLDPTSELAKSFQGLDVEATIGGTQEDPGLPARGWGRGEASAAFGSGQGAAEGDCAGRRDRGKAVADDGGQRDDGDGGGRSRKAEVAKLEEWEARLPEVRSALLAEIPLPSAPKDSRYIGQRIAAAIWGAFGDVLTVPAVVACFPKKGGEEGMATVFDALCRLVELWSQDPVLLSAFPTFRASDAAMPIAGPRLRLNPLILSDVADPPLRKVNVDLASLQQRCARRGLATNGDRPDLVARLVEDEDEKQCTIGLKQLGVSSRPPIRRVEIQHPVAMVSEYPSLHGLRAEHLVLAEPIDNSFQALLYANDDSQPKTINLVVYCPDELEIDSDYRKAHIVISDNGDGMHLDSLTKWATGGHHPAYSNFPDHDPDPDQDAWRHPHTRVAGTSPLQAPMERKKLKEHFDYDGQQETGLGLRAPALYLGTELLVVTKKRGQMVCELHTCKEETDPRTSAAMHERTPFHQDEPWYTSEAFERPVGEYGDSFLKLAHLSKCGSLVQHIKDLEAKHDHFTVFVISSLIPERAKHLLSETDESEFCALCRQLRHMYFFMLGLGDKPYVGGAVELTAEFVRFKRSNGKELYRRVYLLHDRDLASRGHEQEGASRAVTPDAWVDRLSLLHKWAAKRPDGTLEDFEFTIDLSRDPELICYGKDMRVCLWYLPSYRINTLKKVDWPLEQQLEVLYKGRVMPYEFVPSILLVLGVKTVNDPSLFEDLLRVRGVIFLGNSQAVHHTKWSLDPPLVEGLGRRLKSDGDKGVEHGLLGRLLHWLYLCHESERKLNAVTLRMPFRDAPPKHLEGPLYQEMTYGNAATYTVGMKVVAKVKWHRSPEPITVVGTIVAFKPQQAKLGRFSYEGEHKAGGKEHGSGRAEGAAECTVFLQREPQSVFACPEWGVRSPHLWEVSSSDLQEDEDPDYWMSKERANVPDAMSPQKGFAWPPPTLACHQPLGHPAESIARMVVMSAAGPKAPINWATWQQDGTKQSIPKVARRVFLLEPAATTGAAAERELASLAMTSDLSAASESYFEFPGFVVPKPGTYRIEYSLVEPWLPWSAKLPRPTYNAHFTAVVGPPKSFDLEFPILRRQPSPGTNAQADPQPAVRLNKPFEVAIRFFDKEKWPEDDVETSRNACTEFDPDGLRVRVSTFGHENRLCAVQAQVVGGDSTSGKGQPLRAVVLLTRADAHRPAKIALGGTVQAVTFTLEGPGQACSPIRQQLLVLPGPAALLVPADTGDTGGASDFVGLEGVSQVVNREGPLRFKVRFHDSEGNETRSFPPHSRVKLLLTHPRVAPGGAGNQPEVLLERCAVFGADGSLTDLPFTPGAAITECQGALVLDEEGDIAVRDLRLNLDFSSQASAGDTSAGGDRGQAQRSDGKWFQVVDVSVSLGVPAGGQAGHVGSEPEKGLSGQAQHDGFATITKMKTIQVLPSSRPSRVHLCSQDGDTWNLVRSMDAMGRGMDGSTAQYELQPITAGKSLPALAIRIESEAGERLLGPMVQGEVEGAAGAAHARPYGAGWEFQYKVVEAGGKYTSTPAFQGLGIISGLPVPRKAGRHRIEVKVQGMQRAPPRDDIQQASVKPLAGSRRDVEFKQKILLAAVVEPGPHAKWSVLLLPPQESQEEKAVFGTQRARAATGDVSHDGPPRLTLGQPLSQSRLAFVAMDAFDNCVVVEVPPTLRVVPRRAGESAQEPVTFLAEPMQGRDVDAGKETYADAPGQRGRLFTDEGVGPMDTLPGGHLCQVIAGQGQDHDFFCFRSEAEAYLYRQEPILPSPSAAYALEVSSPGNSQVTSRVDVEISNPGVIAANVTVRVHGMPTKQLMSWQELCGVWAEVRVGPLPGRHSVRVFDPLINRMSLEGLSRGLRLVKRDHLLFPALSARLERAKARDPGEQEAAAQQQGPSKDIRNPAMPSPGMIYAVLGEDGRHVFPSLFVVRADHAAGSQGDAGAARLTMRAEAHDKLLAEKILDFTWRPNPSLVKALAIRVDGAGTSARHAVVAGSHVPKFEIALTGEDGVTRDATLGDAPALRVTLKLPDGTHIPLKAQAGSSSTETACFTATSVLKGAGEHHVVVAWTNNTMSDQSSDTTSSCCFDVTPGRDGFRLVAPGWQPGVFDNARNSPRTELFKELEVECVDSYGNRVSKHSGILQLSVFPRDVPVAAIAHVREYAALVEGSPTFEMSQGLLTIRRAQRLQEGAGQKDGHYVLQVAPDPPLESLQPLWLGFYFINRHGRNERVQDIIMQVEHQNEVLQRSIQEYEAAVRAQERYDEAHESCCHAVTDANNLLQTPEPHEQLPQGGLEALYQFFDALWGRLTGALQAAQSEAAVLERDLCSRRPNDGLTETQRGIVEIMVINGHAYGTLPMFVTIEDPGDARLIAWLLEEAALTVVLTPGVPLAVRKAFENVHLGVIGIDDVPPPGYECLPHQSVPEAPVTGNPCFGPALVTLDPALLYGSPIAAHLMCGVIHALLEEAVFLDGAENASSYVQGIVRAHSLRGNVPMLPKMVSRDGRYLRERSGREWPAASIEEELRCNAPAVCFGAPSLSFCPRLRWLHHYADRVVAAWQLFDERMQRLVQAHQQLQPVDARKQVREDAKDMLDQLTAKLRQAEEKQRMADALLNEAPMAHVEPAGVQEMDTRGEG